MHFVWEMGQGGRFASMAPLSFWRATLLCARATAGDVAPLQCGEGADYDPHAGALIANRDAETHGRVIGSTIGAR